MTKALARCSFKEFVNSQFFNDFCTQDRRGRDNYISDYTPDFTQYRLVLCTQDCGYGQYLHTIYKRHKPNGEWVKFIDFSDEQAEDDFVCGLFGDRDTGKPFCVDITSNRFSLVFNLSEEQIEALEQSADYDDNYFPNYVVK